MAKAFSLASLAVLAFLPGDYDYPHGQSQSRRVSRG
jgi:hypothetical protein